jgi:hypothetical protein
MSFTIHPFCENGSSVPRNGVHAGPVSLGLLPKDYKADTSQLWRAGINPSTNLLVASTSYTRGLVGSPTTSTPRYWWIAGPVNSQPALEAKVKEVVGRLPERAVNNYEPFSDYATAYEWAKTNKYALINCNYPAYRLGDYDNTTQSLINIETGFLPSFDGSQSKLRNLANPTESNGFGAASPYAIVHDSITIQSASALGSLASGIGTEVGISQNSSTHISQITGPIQNGITNGIVFEGIMRVPDGTTTSYTLLQARDAGNSTLFRLDWVHGGGPGSGWKIMFGATTAYEELSPSAALAVGQYYFCVSIPRSQTGEPVKLYVGASHGPSAPYVLSEVPGAPSWTVTSVRFTFGSLYNGTSASRQIERFYSAKVHNVAGAWTSDFHEPFHIANWPEVEALYSGIQP